MSYILDALKKSDQERQQNNGPNLQTIQRPHLINKRGGARNLQVVLLFTVVVLLVAAGWYFYGGSISINKASVAAAPVVETQPAPVVTQSLPEPAPTYSEPVEFSQLPDPVQQAVPALTFSFHVYSDNPERRTIIINKRRVREGDAVTPGLVLESITSQGVVLQWQGQHRFTINVVENW